jgi:hypothetical protein
MADKIDPVIDPALVQIASQNYGTVYLPAGDPGYAVVWTSTCVDAPARWPVRREKDYTPQIHASIAARFADLTANSTYCYKQRLYYAGLPYDRGERTVKTALKATGYSAIARST